MFCGNQQATDLGWQSSCHGGEGQTSFPPEVLDVAYKVRDSTYA